MESTVGQELMKMKRENGTYIAPLQKLSPNSALYQNNPELAQKVSILLQKYPTFEEFAKANSPARQLYLCQEPEKCILGNSPWLGLLDAAYGMFASVFISDKTPRLSAERQESFPDYSVLGSSAGSCRGIPWELSGPTR